MSAELMISEKLGCTEVTYTRDGNDGRDSLETGVAAWISGRETDGISKVDLLFGRVGVLDDDSFSASYYTDRSGKTYDMTIDGLDNPVLVTAEFIGSSYRRCDSRRQDTQSINGTNFEMLDINAPGAGFAFGREQIIASLKRKINEVSVSATTAYVIYNSMYYQLFTAQAPVDPYLVDPSMESTTKFRYEELIANRSNSFSGSDGIAQLLARSTSSVFSLENLLIQEQSLLRPHYATR